MVPELLIKNHNIMPLFSNRYGYKPLDTTLQLEGMSDELRNALWSAIDLGLWETLNTMTYKPDCNVSDFQDLFLKIWLFVFKQPSDSLPSNLDVAYTELRIFFFRCKWYEVYDLLEYVANHKSDRIGREFEIIVNQFLEKGGSGYRMIVGTISPITSDVEIETISKASDAPYSNVRTHIRTAINLFSDRNNPDYRNSIKESISAVESLAREHCGKSKASMGELLKELEKRKVLHPAQKSAFSALYGYTSDADGIRHAVMEKTDLSQADANFMLVVCSAFVNFVISETNT